MQIIGYIATLLTILSFVPKEQIKLRLINGIASIIWIVYGLGNNDVPVILVNSAVLLVHGFWFYKQKSKTIVIDTTYTADKMANELKHDPDFMYKWIRKNSGK